MAFFPFFLFLFSFLFLLFMIAQRLAWNRLFSAISRLGGTAATVPVLENSGLCFYFHLTFFCILLYFYTRIS